MKKIGFIDYYLDEWHAENYPQFFKDAAGERMEVAYAYGEIDSPNGITNSEWAIKHNIELVSTIEELINLSDYIIVLAPDNPETHVRLAEKALQSGKPVYIDKTFALSLSEAKAIFDTAASFNTPCYSSSALYFAEELQAVKKENISRIASFGSGTFENYLVHQAEQIVSLMGCEVKKVMYIGNETNPVLLAEFSNSRFAEISFFNGQNFNMVIGYNDSSSCKLEIKEDFWKNCIDAMASFFENPVPPVSHEQTLTVVSLIEAGISAKKKPFTWIALK